MATAYTDNYNLDLYTGTDKPNLRDQYNSAMRKIDGALYSDNCAITNLNNQIADVNRHYEDVLDDVKAARASADASASAATNAAADAKKAADDAESADKKADSALDGVSDLGDKLERVAGNAGVSMTDVERPSLKSRICTLETKIRSIPGMGDCGECDDGLFVTKGDLKLVTDRITSLEDDVTCIKNWINAVPSIVEQNLEFDGCSGPIPLTGTGTFRYNPRLGIANLYLHTFKSNVSKAKYTANTVCLFTGDTLQSSLRPTTDRTLSRYAIFWIDKYISGDDMETHDMRTLEIKIMSTGQIGWLTTTDFSTIDPNNYAHLNTFQGMLFTQGWGLETKGIGC